MRQSNFPENSGPTEAIRIPTADRNDKRNKDKYTNWHAQDRPVVSTVSPPNPPLLLPQGIKGATFSVPRQSVQRKEIKLSIEFPLRNRKSRNDVAPFVNNERPSVVQT